MACVEIDTLSAYCTPEQIYLTQPCQLPRRALAGGSRQAPELTHPHQWKNGEVDLPQQLAVLFRGKFTLGRMNDVLGGVADLALLKGLSGGVVALGGNGIVLVFFGHCADDVQEGIGVLAMCRVDFPGPDWTAVVNRGATSKAPWLTSGREHGYLFYPSLKAAADHAHWCIRGRRTAYLKTVWGGRARQSVFCCCLHRF